MAHGRLVGELVAKEHHGQHRDPLPARSVALAAPRLERAAERERARLGDAVRVEREPPEAERLTDAGRDGVREQIRAVIANHVAAEPHVLEERREAVAQRLRERLRARVANLAVVELQIAQPWAAARPQ